MADVPQFAVNDVPMDVYEDIEGLFDTQIPVIDSGPSDDLLVDIMDSRRTDSDSFERSDLTLVDVMFEADTDSALDQDDTSTTTDVDLIWTNAQALPNVRIGTVVGSYAGQIMVATGAGSGGTLTADAQIFDIGASVWGTGAIFAPIRRYASGAVLNGQLYIALGLAPNNQGLASVVRYNPAQNAWKALLDNPIPGCCAGAAGVQERIWLFGGRLGSATVQSFSPSQGVWITHTSMPVGASFPAVVSDPAGEYIYVFGGTTADTPDGGITHGMSQRYSISTDEWTLLEPMPDVRASAAAVSLPGAIWVLGGETDQLPAQSSVYVYSPNDGTWAEAPPMPRARSRHGAAVVSGAIYLVGGLDENKVPITAVDVGIVDSD